MARVLISVMPFAGHVAPVTGVVAALLDRGHEVAVYTGTRYLARFEELGATTIPWTEAPDFDEHQLAATFPEVGRRGPRGLLANLEHVFIRTGSGQARDLLAAHSRRPFDVIAGDVMSLGTGLAAEVTALPWATLSIVPLSLPSRDLPPSGLGLHPGRGPLGRARDAVLRGAASVATRRLDHVLRKVRASVGLPRGASFDSALYSPQLVIATGSPSLEYPRSDLGAHFRFVGRLAPATTSSAEAPPWRDELRDPGATVVLATQGTFNVDPADLLRPALTALADRDALVLATADAAGLGIPVPRNARLARRIDFTDVLPQVDLMITNGGWGGVLEALSHGIPLIVAGGDLDKPEIAARVAWARAGIDLRTGHPSPAAVARAFDRVVADSSFAQGARRIADELSALGGATQAASLIEQLV